jgi:hypothetical protein
MNAPRRKQPAPAQSPLRALTLFETLPPGHKTFRVPDDGSSPHLEEQEFAVIDTTDREPQHGELFLIQWDTGRRSRSILQFRAGMCQISRTEITGTEPETKVWWLSDLAGFRPAGTHGGIPLFTGMTAGPYDAAENYLQKQLIGRVVGYSTNSFGHLIAPEAGWEDEEEGNEAFDPAEYVDVLIAAGYQPSVFQRRDGSMGLYETNPLERMPTEPQHEAYMAVRTKYCAASKAHDRVVAECLRRGLID